MLKHTLRTLRRCVGMAWHLGGHALPVLLHAIRVRRQRGEVVFIDLGAANGDTAEQAMALWPRLDRLILFEPGRTRFDRLQQRFGSDKRVELVRAAAGAETIESARLYHERPMGDGRYFQGQGDSLLAMKRNIDTSDFEEVQILAFSAFLLEKTTPNDRVILKVDIEGGEYDLLEAMCRDRSIERVSRLFCEWHGNKMGIPAQRHQNLVGALQRRGLPITGLNRYDEFRLRRREIS